jgi:hypothetical protein
VGALEHEGRFLVDDVAALVAAGGYLVHEGPILVRAVREVDRRKTICSLHFPDN